MNKWNELLAALDRVYGFTNQVKSSFKKVKQDFDEKSNEHVILIEYRVLKGEDPAKRNKKERTRAKEEGQGVFLKDLLKVAIANSKR